ncbi:SspB-related isopeptide-forming adhesin [Streptococcus suis]|uniref:SspB-related isopeptide-forming adhesin n=1 Tax=Streptococcus suis TaxID=1307 RepID=UPI000CF5A11F|nr:SspB-related isopeptide-forming adhesin [Streptococcus suis]
MYQKDIQGKGYFRKSKAYGLVCGIALFGALAVGSTVSADEVTTTVETTPTVEAVNPNPATNLTTVQEAPSTESVATEEKSGTSTGEIVSPVTSSELSNAVDTAKDAGVTVTEETKPVVHDNLASAQDDLSKQASEVKVAEDKQEQNTTAIKDAIATNEEIDRQNKAEAERVAEVNRVGQAEVEARNKAGQEAVDARNAQAVAKRESEAEAVEARNKAGQEAVDARNKSGQAMTDTINKAEQERADLENARLKAEYEAELAKIADVEAYNAEIRKRNAEAIAKAEADNARLKAEYEAKKAEMQAKTKENGYLSEAVVQSLILLTEPNAKLSISSSNKIEMSQDDKNANAPSKWDSTNNISSYSGTGKAIIKLDKGESVTATYENLSNSSYAGTPLSKIVFTYSAQNATGNVIDIATDPTITVTTYSELYETSRVNAHVELFDENNKKIVFTEENPAIFSLASLNYSKHDLVGANFQETVENFSNNVTIIPITGSGIVYENGSVHAANFNDKVENGSKYPSQGEGRWDDTELAYYGAIAGKVTSGDYISFDIVSKVDITSGVNQAGWTGNAFWFAFNTDVKAPVLPPLPPYKQITPEQEKEVPTKPVEPTYVTPTLVTFTPEVFVPEKYNPEPFVPEVFTPETFDPITPKMIPHVEVPEKETYSVSVHPVIVKQTPANIKAVVNEDGISVDGQLVPKGSVQTWVLTNANLKAGRPITTSYSMTDPLPTGFELDMKATAEKNSAWVFSYDENGRGVLTATESTLKLLNANLNQDVGIPLAYFVGRTLNDGGTYKNTFVTNIGTPSGIYTTVSNVPVIYTPGNDPKTPRPPRVPNGDNPTPHDNLIQPKKDVVDEKGNSINGQSVLPNTVLNYVAEQDFDQYKGIVASQNAIGKGFLYVDDYLDEAIDGTSLVVNSITAANGDDVRELFDMIHVLSKDSLDEKLQALIQDSGISPVGEFYLWVAKDPEAFYKAYVQQGLDITRNLSFKIKQDFVGTITNQTHQVDFGNGYYGNIVTNEVPQLVVHKDVLDKDGKSIDNGTVQIGDLVTYKLEGWVIPAGRGYDIKEYRFVDLLQHSHDDYQSVVIEAKVDFTLPDGTIIKKGDDISSYTETVYNAQTGKFETRFKEAFLAQITRDQAFGADGYITVKRIASGTVENEYTLYVNGNPVLSNKVVTETPEPPKPEPKAPKQETPALPNTGQSSSLGLTVLGMVALFGSLFGLRKKNEE